MEAGWRVEKGQRDAMASDRVVVIALDLSSKDCLQPRGRGRVCDWPLAEERGVCG